MGDAITVENLSKRFYRYHAEKPTTVMEAVLSGLRRITPVEDFWALRQINFTVAAGEMLGVIGHNGAGKSTLLQLLGGVTYPSEGRIRIHGRIGALLDLGAGFHGDLTGRENVFTSAIVAGLTRREVARRFEQIVEFAELAHFIDNPTRTYSTGMLMRLAFSVAIHTNPQVLLVDEFLSVGDLAFQTKCLERITQLKMDGCAIVFISHSPEQVQQLCDRALWLRHGQVVAYGNPDMIAGQYVSEMRSQTQQRTPIRPPQLTRSGVELRVNENRFGSLEVEIVDVQLLPTDAINSGDALTIEIHYQAAQRIESPIFGISISCNNEQTYLDINTATLNSPISTIQGEGKIKLHIDRLDLSAGEYFMDVGIYEQNWAYAYDYHWHTYPFSVRSTVESKGLLSPPHRWEVSNLQISSATKS